MYPAEESKIKQLILAIATVFQLAGLFLYALIASLRKK